MADVICSVCGERNLQDAKHCQACGADLEMAIPAGLEDMDAADAVDAENGIDADDGLDFFEEPEEDLPGLLHTLKEEHTQAPSGESETVDPADVSVPDSDLFPEDREDPQEIPDWLNRVRQRAREEEDAVGDLIRRTAAHEENLNPENRDARHESFEAWIERLRDEARDKASGSPEDISDPEEDDGLEESAEPEWLTRIRVEQHDIPAVDGAGLTAVSAAQGQDLPDWLMNLSEEDGAEAETDPEGIDFKDAAPQAPTAEADEAAPVDPSPQAAAFLESRAVAAPEPETGGAASETESDNPLEIEGEPSDKKHLGSPLDAEPDEADALEADPIQDQATGDESEKNADLQATRQIFPPPLEPEQDVTREIRGLASGEGPEGWLIAQAAATMPGRVPGKRAPLEVTPKQQQQAELLAAVIADERSPRPAGLRSKLSSAWLLRLVIGLLLVLTLVFSLFTGEQQAAPDIPLSPSAAALISGLDALPADAAVLLIFDVQPGYSGEMAMVSGPVLSELVQEGRVIYTAGSSASAPLLAQRFLTEVVDEEGLSFSEDRIVDLGYFPVDTYGHFGMAASLASPQTLLGFMDPLASLDAAFVDAVFLIADRFEGARLWMEQLGTLAPDRPVYLLVSAQAGPMLNPYWDSGQAAGLISGISDTVALEAHLSRPGEGARRWQAYQAGKLLIAALLTIGLIFGFERSSGSRHRGDA
jgi:hypothetical protein